jgi:hypothetical protein
MHSIVGVTQKNILLIIRNLSGFYPLEDREDSPFSINADDIIRAFSEYILPFWQIDHKFFGSSLKSKNFSVYYT